MDKHLKRAEVLFEQGRYDLAIRELRQELTINPDCGDSHSLLGRCLTQQQKYEEALIELTASIRLEAERSDFHHALAHLYLVQNSLEVAKTTIKEAIRLNPEEPQHIFCLAAILYQEAKKWELQGMGAIFNSQSLKDRAKSCWQESLNLLGQARRLNPTQVSYVNLQISIADKLGKSNLSAKYTEEAVTLDPENALAHSNYGWLLLEREEYVKAGGYFESALQIDANLEPAKRGLLESLRARFWLYRLVSCHYKIPSTNIPMGVLPIGMFFLSLFLSFIYLGLLEPVAKQYLPLTISLLLNKLFIVLVMLSVLWGIFSQLAPYIYNWFLQFNRLGRQMLSQIDFIKASIWGVVGITGFVFLVTLLIMPENLFPTKESREQLMLIEIGAGAGLLPFALVPSLEGDRSKKIMWIYGAIAVLFGLVSLAIYTYLPQPDNLLRKGSISLYLLTILVSPLVALQLNEKNSLAGDR